jgi:hypothetical protein
VSAETLDSDDLVVERMLVMLWGGVSKPDHTVGVDVCLAQEEDLSLTKKEDGLQLHIEDLGKNVGTALPFTDQLKDVVAVVPLKPKVNLAKLVCNELGREVDLKCEPVADMIGGLGSQIEVDIAFGALVEDPFVQGTLLHQLQQLQTPKLEVLCGITIK